MNNPDYSTILQNTAFLNLKEVGKFNYKDTKMMLFHIIRKGNKYDYTQEELKKYIKVEFIQRTENWNNEPGNQYNSRYYKAKDCE